METSIFVKIEIIIFFLSFTYITYFIWEKAFHAYFHVKKIVEPKKVKWRSKKSKKIQISQNSSKSWENQEKKLTETEKQKLADIVKRAKINASKWYFETARHIIVEWLSIDKFNKDLNIELAGIYEKEHNYKNAEFIYKDLIDAIWKDCDVMKKLWMIYALQNKLDEALQMYEKVHKKKKDDTEVINMLWDITFELQKYDAAKWYLKMILKDKPRNVDRLLMLAVCYESLHMTDDAFDTYKKIVELQPYNTLARNKLNELFALKN